jgi:hypothetical protein
MRRPLVIYDFATAPLFEENFLFFFISVEYSKGETEKVKSGPVSAYNLGNLVLKGTAR